MDLFLGGLVGEKLIREEPPNGRFEKDLRPARCARRSCPLSLVRYAAPAVVCARLMAAVNATIELISPTTRSYDILLTCLTGIISPC